MHCTILTSAYANFHSFELLEVEALRLSIFYEDLLHHKSRETWSSCGPSAPGGSARALNPPPSCGPQVEPAGQSLVSSDPEDGDLMQDCLEDRKYPGEVTSSSLKVKLQPKDSKKELLS